MNLWHRARQLLEPPALPEEEPAHLARVTHYLLLVVMSGGALVALGNAAIADWGTVGVAGGAALILAGALALNRRGRVQAAGMTLLLTMLAAVSAALALNLGVHDVGALFFPAIVVIAGLLLSRRSFLIVLGLTLAAVAGLAVGEWRGWFTPAPYDQAELPADFLTAAAVLAITALAARLMADNLAASLARARRELGERQQAEAALQHSQAMLQAILDNSQAIIYIKDLDGRYLLVNPQYARLAQRSAAEILGRTDHDILSPEGAALIRRNDLAVIAAGAPLEFEEIDRRPDGEHITLSVKFPLRDATGQVMAVGGISTDITARKRAQTALQERELLLRAILDSVPADLWVCDEQDRYILQNRISVELAGILIGKTLDDLPLPPDLREAYREKHLRALGGETVLDEISLQVDGETRWYHSLQAPIRDGDRIRGFVGLNLDITDRRRAEQALRDSEAKFQTAFQASPLALAVRDQRGRFVEVNQAFLRLVDYPSETVLGRTSQELELWASPAELEAANAAFARDGHLRDFEGRLRRRSGGVAQVLLSQERVRLGGQTHYLVLLVDITDRKQAEAEREALIAELEAKNAELERFTYTVSHDLKSPLITIRGYLGYVRRDALAGETGRLQRDLTRIEAATDRMQRLLNELLELSRVGRLMNPPETVPFEAIARDAVWLVEGRIQARHVVVEVAAGLPLIHGDRLRLVEAMQNLVDNAVKFMGDQPHPRIEIGQRGRDAAGHPVLFVRDNGQGIAPEYQHKIFGLFDKLDADSEGTGIGLALVKRIVEVHGGRIWVESPGSGGGATFLFTLPPPPERG